jgi:C-terminal processing protease CtpA/Prc
MSAERCASLLAALFLMAACGGTDKWMGSVDAVFRYRPSDRTTVVHEVRPGSLSERAGLEPGDRLLVIDGKDVTDMPFEQVRESLRGPVGTRVRLSIQRDGELLEIEMERRPLREDTP